MYISNKCIRGKNEPFMAVLVRPKKNELKKEKKTEIVREGKRSKRVTIEVGDENILVWD